MSAWRSAIDRALVREPTVLFIFTTMPFFNPSDGASPTPRILIELSVLSHSAMTTAIFVVPISIPLIICFSSNFILFDIFL